MSHVLELETRRKIYNLILRNPGLHANKIATDLSMSGQLADYHLAYLEKNNLVVAVKEEGFRRYYIKGSIGLEERTRISILRHETPLRIVLFLLEHPYSTHGEILQHLSIVKSTLSYHLTKLLEKGIITTNPDDTEKRYVVVNEKEIVELLIRYKPYSRIESFKDTWVDLKWPRTP
jgi:predicted transcriptional regulator